jgi:hypothetical protein
MDRDDLNKYLDSLSPPFRALFYQVEDFCRECADTLDEEFQLAAAIEAVFWERARQRKEGL